jgi:methyltransferase family protein
MRIQEKLRKHASKKHFTKPPFADALLGFVEAQPSCVLDPAVGHGALLAAASKRWPRAKFIGFDISKNAVKAAKVNLPGARLLCKDAFQITWKLEGNTLPLIVCNPPFLGESLLPLAKRLDVRFLDRCIATLKDTGVLIFVFPQSIASSPSFRDVRANWLSRAMLTTSIELPQNAFEKTEASAVAVILKPGKPTGRGLVEFVVLGRNAQIAHQTTDSIDESFRFDPKYYILRNRMPKVLADLRRFGEITQDVRRGIFVRKTGTRSKHWHPYIHSTNLQHGWIADQEKAVVGPSVQTNVEAGSVLLSRVGKKLWRKFALYTTAYSSTASDCLYVVKTGSLLTSSYLVATLTTKYMQLALRRTTRGTTVPILNKKELLELSVPWLPSKERTAIGTAWLNATTRVQQTAVTAMLENRLSYPDPAIQ